MVCRSLALRLALELVAQAVPEIAPKSDNPATNRRRCASKGRSPASISPASPSAFASACASPAALNTPAPTCGRATKAASPPAPRDRAPVLADRRSAAGRAARPPGHARSCGASAFGMARIVGDDVAGDQRRRDRHSCVVPFSVSSAARAPPHRPGRYQTKFSSDGRGADRCRVRRRDSRELLAGRQENTNSSNSSCVQGGRDARSSARAHARRHSRHMRLRVGQD